VSLNQVNLPPAQSVLLATDFSDTSHNAFGYALALSLLHKTKLTLLHVGDAHRGVEGWTKFPPVRQTLERWGLLEPGSPRSAVFEKFSVRVKKVGINDRRPARAIVRYLDEHPSELLVLGTEPREGLPRWTEPSVAEAAAEKSTTPSLFVPAGARGFVDSDSGKLNLRRILVPVSGEDNPESAMAVATRAAFLMRADESEKVEVIVLHVGDPAGAPEMQIPDTTFCNFKSELRQGKVADEIVAAATEHEIDLIVMMTNGQNSLIDVVKGSNTQQVLRRSPCVLLAIPADAHIAELTGETA
jgi:nucleotide-binding universal stress UspA family protein